MVDDSRFLSDSTGTCPLTGFIAMKSLEYQIDFEIFDELRNTPLFKEILFPSFLKTVGQVDGLEILDVGCGDGFYSKHFASNGAKLVMGIDSD